MHIYHFFFQTKFVHQKRTKEVTNFILFIYLYSLSKVNINNKFTGTLVQRAVVPSKCVL